MAEEEEKAKLEWFKFFAKDEKEKR